MKSVLLLMFIVLASLIVGGCSSVKIVDANVKEAEEDQLKEGIIYYPQRPYLVVKKPFVVEGEEGYVTAKIKEDGLHFQTPWSKDEKVVPLSAVIINTNTNQYRRGGGVPEQTSTKDAAAAAAAAANAAKDGGTNQGEADTSTSTSSEDTKIYTESRGNLSWDSSVPSEIDLTDQFKIVYLPDVDNPRVIQIDAGLGVAEVDVAMGPGDTINKFNLREDNQELGRFFMDTIKDTIDLAKKYGTMAIGITPQLTSSKLEKKGYEVDDTLVLKYIYLGEATPGVYPLVKEREFIKAEELENTLVIRKDSQGRLSFGPPAKDDFLIRPEYPYTRFAFKVNRKFQLYIEDFEQDSTPSGGSGKKLSAEEKQKLKTQVETFNKVAQQLNSVFKGNAIPVTITDDNSNAVTYNLTGKGIVEKDYDKEEKKGKLMKTDLPTSLSFYPADFNALKNASYTIGSKSVAGLEAIKQPLADAVKAKLAADSKQEIQDLADLIVIKPTKDKIEVLVSQQQQL